MAFKDDSGQYTRYVAREFTAQQAGTGPAPAGPVPAEGLDGTLVLQAVELLVSTQFGSASTLHRKLRIGFALTETLPDFLHQLDIVGPSDGSKTPEIRGPTDDLEAKMMKLANELGFIARDLGAMGSRRPPLRTPRSRSDRHVFRDSG
ncbi:DNA translocase FtsK [Streptomyces mirabilis]|uniref:DNA translocase FtsK n=1 Tax=Streptomyces mirabilis TaxID=68239 RepID=UPI0036E7F2FD